MTSAPPLAICRASSRAAPAKSPRKNRDCPRPTCTRPLRQPAAIAARNRERRLAVAPLFETDQAEPEGGLGKRRDRGPARPRRRPPRGPCRASSFETTARPSQARAGGGSSATARSSASFASSLSPIACKVKPRSSHISAMTGRDGRRRREHEAGQTRIARRPMGEGEPAQRMRRVRAFAQQGVEAGIAGAPDGDPRIGLPPIDLHDEAGQGADPLFGQIREPCRRPFAPSQIAHDGERRRACGLLRRGRRVLGLTPASNRSPSARQNAGPLAHYSFVKLARDLRREPGERPPTAPLTSRVRRVFRICSAPPAPRMERSARCSA